MANSRTTLAGEYRTEEASVDTDPGADGYGCNSVTHLDAYQSGGRQKVFYISQIGTGAVVTLQWKRDTATTWTDFEDYTEVTRETINEQAYGIQWRAIVKDNAQGSAGASVFGICY